MAKVSKQEKVMGLAEPSKRGFRLRAACAAMSLRLILSAGSIDTKLGQLTEK